jgi:flavin-binding protein dodecin
MKSFPFGYVCIEKLKLPESHLVLEVESMPVVKIIELIGSSADSWEDAVGNAVKEAAKTVKNIKGVHVKRCTAKVKANKIVEYRADVKIAFIVER